MTSSNSPGIGSATLPKIIIASRGPMLMIGFWTLLASSLNPQPITKQNMNTQTKEAIDPRGSEYGYFSATVTGDLVIVTRRDMDGQDLYSLTIAAGPDFANWASDASLRFGPA
jgi:hypothetical protein